MAFEGFVPPVPPSQDEMLRRRRNRDELRSVYDSYRRIKYCLSQKDARLMPDFEQAYLALITASRGCTSAQRILAELIPRYASHCPTALEAAAKVAINMYNWSFATISRGEDYDGVAFQIAKACIFGLVDICGIASSEAPTSSVIRGICSAVFLNVLTFFISSFDGKDIHEIGNKFIAVVQDSKFFSKLKQEVADEGEPMLPKLFRLRALCLLRILFCYPKNLLAACFESLKSGETETGSFASGNYLLRQVTNLIDAKYPLDKMSHEGTPQTKSMEIIADGVDTSAVGQVSCGNQVSEDASQVTKNCLVGMVLSKDPFLRDWFFVKYKKLSISLDPQILSEITLALENVFGSFLEQIKEADTEGDSDEEKSDPSKYVNRQYLLPRISNQQDDFTKRSDKDQTKRIPRTVAGDDSDSEMAEGSHSKDLETGEHEVSQHLTPPMRKPFVSNVFPSPITKTPLEHKSDTSEGAKQFIQGDMNQVSNANFGFPATRPSMEGLPDVFASFENHHYGRSNVDSSNRIGWYFDGDPAAMDVFSASKQLWLGSLGPVASESLVKFQFEKFGPVELFLFFPTKGFALVEYRNIMDAIRAREHMRGSSPWGAILQVKFLDAGLGSRGSINGVAVGWSSHVYVGNVSSHWIKDEIMHGLLRAGFRHPRTVSDLTTESALLMEFETAEEANVVMTHLRKLRKDNGYHVPINKSLTPKPCKVDVPRSHMDSARFFSASIHQDFRSNNSGSISNSMVGSPHVPPAFDSPNEDSKMRMSQLSSLLLSISSKCNTIKNHSNDNHIPKIVSDEDKVPTNTLCIGLPELDFSSSYLSDDDIMAVCNHAVGNLGSVVRLKRENIQIGFLWYVEFNSIDVAVTVMKILRSCPAMLFQISFSQPGNTQLINKSERSSHELVSPRMEPGSHRSVVQCSHPLQSNWSSSGCTEVREVGTRNIGNSDRYDTNITPDFSQAKSRSLSHANEQVWTYKKPERELQFPATGSMQYPPVAAHGMTVLPPQQIQPFMRPNYYTPNSSWNAHNAHHPLPMNHMNPAIMPNHLHVHVAPPPFLPASVTPLSQMPGNSVQHLDRMVSMPYAPALSSFPPPPHIPPPWPPSPPPLPVSQPPLVPPPPSSPPPLQSAVGPSKTGNAAQGLPAQWQGVLCKSGVHYSQVYAYREDSDACKYSNVIPEPTGWPAKLDVTKRTDFQHVKSTYTSTPPHRREVCRLLPCASEDHKGFQDFITYLKQRECAGVIKIPAEKNMWARLLFILPYSHETCSMLAIAPHPSECLIGLVVPKETNLDFV